MHRYLKFGWLDNLDTVRHIALGRLWGVTISVTPTVWLFPVVFGILRLATIAIGKPLSFDVRLSDALAFTIGVAIFTLVHSLGHVLSGKLAGSAMDELLFTDTRAVNIYRGDQSGIPGRVHILRSVGGPVANLICAALLYLVLPFAGTDFLAAVVASTFSTSLVAGLFSFLPIPSIDGWVIWREVLRALRPTRSDDFSRQL